MHFTLDNGQKVIFDEKYDVRTVLAKLRQLEEEEPQLRIVWNEQAKEIHLSLMGEIQLEIIKTLCQQRFGIDISFDAGKNNVTIASETLVSF